MTAAEPAGRWRLLAVLAGAVLLALVPWFSAASVAPLIAGEWRIGALETALLTVAVQLGFAAGALAIAVSGAADVIPAHRLIAGGALLASAGNAAFGLLADDLLTAVPLRALSGAGIAAVYPVAMKVLAGWFARERGLAVGVLIGAITLGSAAPHGIRALGSMAGLDWRSVVLAASASGLLAAILAWRGVREGPLTVPAARLSLRMARRALGEPSVRLANLGYLGHMWELYAMWTWIASFLVASAATRSAEALPPLLVRLSPFLVIAAGGLGCVWGGRVADRIGREALTIRALAVSGACALGIGFLFGGPFPVVVAVALVWGFFVVADSAQFSAAVTEVVPPHVVGTALTLQVALGFLLTMATIQLVPVLVSAVGWRWAFSLLAAGPLAGVLSMARLRRLRSSDVATAATIG